MSRMQERAIDGQVTSDLSVLSQSPSPPSESEQPSFFRSSISLSDSSELSMLSRSPSLPSHGEEIIHQNQDQTKPPSTVEHDCLKLTAQCHSCPESSSDATSHVSETILSSFPTQGIKRKLSKDKEEESVKKLKDQDSISLEVHEILTPSLGTLSLLPKEVRQEIFGHALCIDHPIQVRHCCNGDVYVRYERYSNSDRGRFNILAVSKSVYFEASWVLHNRCILNLLIGACLIPFVEDYRHKTIHRLGDIPPQEKVSAMWHSVSRFRFVEINIPATVMVAIDASRYTEMLRTCVSLLLKSWAVGSSQPSSRIPHTVIIDLGSLFNEQLPFNIEHWMQVDYSNPMFQMGYVGVHLWLTPYSIMRRETEINLRKLVAIIGCNRGDSEWKVKALDHSRNKYVGGGNRNDDSKGRAMFEQMRASCLENGFGFEGVSKKEWEAGLRVFYQKNKALYRRFSASIIPGCDGF